MTDPNNDDPVQTWSLIDDLDIEVEQYTATGGDMCAHWDGTGGYGWRVVNLSKGVTAMICLHDWQDWYDCARCGRFSEDLDALDIPKLIAEGVMVHTVCPPGPPPNQVTVRRTRNGVRVIIADLVTKRVLDAPLTLTEARNLATLLTAFAEEVT